MTVRDSTLSDNTATDFGGGGILNKAYGTLTVVNSTLSGNTGRRRRRHLQRRDGDGPGQHPHWQLRRRCRRRHLQRRNPDGQQQHPVRQHRQLSRWWCHRQFRAADGP